MLAKKVKVSWNEFQHRMAGPDVRRYTDLLGSEKINLVIGKFEPGEQLKPHYHKSPIDEIYYLYKGSCTVYVGDDNYEANEGDAFFVSGGTVHYLVNNSKDTCWFVFILSPVDLEGTVYV